MYRPKVEIKKKIHRSKIELRERINKRERENIHIFWVRM